jgi:cytochrome c-type biogenesis protein
MAVATRSRTVGSRWFIFSHALAFVLGFSLVFVTLGASVAFLGYALNQYLPLFVKFGGVILIVFGLYIAGLFSWIADRVAAAGGDRNPLGRGYIAFVDGLSRLMYTEGRVQKQVDRRWGYLSSFLMGVFFSAGWIPCVGPVLAAIYLLASDTATVAQGALLLLAYSAGLGIPFLFTGLLLNEMTGVLRSMNRHARLVSKITGIFLILIGILLFNDRLSLIANLIVARVGTGLASVDFGGTAAITIPIAFIAGLLSFLSPCVLPIIPAYIGYLGGTAVANGAVAAGGADATAAKTDAAAARVNG